MLYSFLIAILNFVLIEIFASAYYFLYFIALLVYIYFFNFKINIYQITSIVLCFFVAFYYLDQYIFEFFLYFEIYNYYIHIDKELIAVLTTTHIILLKYVSYYFDLKKMGYNLIKN
jgi:hypothetical protein